MGFSGWPTEAVEFFQGLRADNTKAYWNTHKAVYEASVREPMAQLLDGLSGATLGVLTALVTTSRAAPAGSIWPRVSSARFQGSAPR